MTQPRLNLANAGPGPEDYKCLQAEFERRKRRFLRMLAYEHRDDVKDAKLVLALKRKYLTDREVSDSQLDRAWARLRRPPSEEWRKRLTPANRDAKKDRTEKKATLWTDDMMVRDGGLWVVGEEDVNVVTARLAIDSMERSTEFIHLHDHDDVPWEEQRFPPEILAKVPPSDARASTKALVRLISDMGLVQVGGGDMQGKSIRDVLLDRIAHINIDASDATKTDPATGKPVKNDDLVDRLKPIVTAFLDTLHLEVPRADNEQRRDFIARWLGMYPGVDPSLLADQFGLDHARVVLELRDLCPNTADIRRIVELHAWLAMLAYQPVRVSLPALSDMLAFNGEPSWSSVYFSLILTLTDTAYMPPAPARSDWLTDGDDTLYRTLVCQPGKGDPDGRQFFRMAPAPVVPLGWKWPAKDPDFVYWWRAILQRHCAEHLMALKETADFHVTDLLCFCFLFDLYGSFPDVRVPRYVAECIRAALLNFKYWFDEPPERGPKGVEMTFWSENHQIQFHSSQFLVGHLFPDSVFPRSGNDAKGQPMTGREHEKRGRERLERWLDRRLALGFSEWNSPGYYNEDFPPVLNVVDFSPDERIARKAAMVVDLLVFDLARYTCQGSFGVSAGRAYFEHKAYGWEQSVGETIEVLFGTRRDHRSKENTAIALCTSQKYKVPDALLAIGRDRILLDQLKPMEFRSRVSINTDEARSHGVGFETAADAAFWWGCGAYFDPATLELTRSVAGRYKNLDITDPPGLLFRFDLIGGFLQTLLLDTAEMAAGGALGAGSSLLIMAPFPLNLIAGATYITSVSMMIEGLVSLIGDLAAMIENALDQAKAWLLGEEPPKPEIPRAALMRAWEAMLMQFNSGNVLSRANLYTYSIGDAMLSSVQNHRAREISFQKQPWLASLGLDACVWTNAPMDPAAAIGSVGWEVFKHVRHFFFIGEQEHFDPDLHKLARMLGWQLPSVTPRDVVGSYEDYRLSDDDMEFLRQITRLDVELWNEIRARHIVRPRSTVVERGQDWMQDAVIEARRRLRGTPIWRMARAVLRRGATPNPRGRASP